MTEEMNGEDAAYLSGYQAGQASKFKEIEALKVENEQFRKDAERYRCVRSNSFTHPFAIVDKDMQIICDKAADKLIDTYLTDFSTT